MSELIELIELIERLKTPETDWMGSITSCSWKGNTPMIERLQRALEHIEQVPPPMQADLAQRIEDLIGQDTLAAPSESQRFSDPARQTQERIQKALGLAGTWSDMPDTFDEMLDALDHIRHDSPPSPAMDEQLAWLDEPAARQNGDHSQASQDIKESTR